LQNPQKIETIKPRKNKKSKKAKRFFNGNKKISKKIEIYF